MSTSDHEINRNVRGVLSRHWVDLSSTSFVSRKGVVRVVGKLRRIGPKSDSPLDNTSVVALDSELRKLRGVRRVHFDLANWRRTEDGEWVRIERRADTGGQRSRTSGDDGGEAG